MNGSFEQWSGRKGFDEKERTRIDNRLGNLVTSLASKIHDLETYETSKAYPAPVQVLTFQQGE